MSQNYQLTGLTCDGCSNTVVKSLLKIEGIKEIKINSTRDRATILMDHFINTDVLKEALKNYPKYTIADVTPDVPAYKIPITSSINETTLAAERPWLLTYKPILLIFAYITLVSLVAASNNPMYFMQYFMAGFFLVFSFFKLLDLAGFAESYKMYDIVAQKIPAYAHLYPFIELALGIAFLTRFNPFLTNITTLIVMGVSAIGVIQSVLNKKKIQCACLGAVFNLPMSTVTIIEDLLMVAMSAAMLILI